MVDVPLRLGRARRGKGLRAGSKTTTNANGKERWSYCLRAGPVRSSPEALLDRLTPVAQTEVMHRLDAVGDVPAAALRRLCGHVLSRLGSSAAGAVEVGRGDRGDVQLYPAAPAPPLVLDGAHRTLGPPVHAWRRSGHVELGHQRRAHVQDIVCTWSQQSVRCCRHPAAGTRKATLKTGNTGGTFHEKEPSKLCAQKSQRGGSKRERWRTRQGL